MQYVRSFSGSVSKTWNSINPATLSGAIDVVVVEQEDGSLACSPFHVRFGKFSLLRPSEKKVEFKVNGIKQNYSMKLGDGGEAFFVFETTDDIPEALQTSPLISPATSPDSLAAGKGQVEGSLQEPEFLDLSGGTSRRRPLSTIIQSQPLPAITTDQRPQSDIGNITPISGSPPSIYARPLSGEWTSRLARAQSEELLPGMSRAQIAELEVAAGKPLLVERSSEPQKVPQISSTSQARSTSPPPVTIKEAVNRAISLSKKLSISNIPTLMTESGDLMLDMTGYKSSEEDALRAELIARKILSEELQGNYDIGALMGADERGNVWIYSSEEAKEAAARKSGLVHPSIGLSDAASDPGYHSDEERSDDGMSAPPHLQKVSSDQRGPGIVTPPQTPPEQPSAGDPNRNYAKTLRLTSDQLKALNLKMGANDMSFSVNRATCQASMFYWSYDVPVVISDIDGTITKSDALGHVLNMIGRDWTHLGVAKLYHDIAANGYNILYLTSRSVGQSDTTRAYLHGITQEGYKLPKGPVILSPDRTIAALRREVYLRKPEVFKMACLRDILNLFGADRNPFYAGFGNRLTDAMSYRSVRIPQNRIFTINSNAEVSLDLLTFNKYRSSYVSIREIVDHFFPPVGLLVKDGGENFTDFNYWREPALGVDDFSGSESDEESVYQRKADNTSIQSEDEGSEGIEDRADRMGESFMSRDSVDGIGDITNSILESVEGDEDDEFSRKDSFESFAESMTAIVTDDGERGRATSRNDK